MVAQSCIGWSSEWNSHNDSASNFSQVTWRPGDNRREILRCHQASLKVSEKFLHVIRLRNAQSAKKTTLCVQIKKVSHSICPSYHFHFLSSDRPVWDEQGVHQIRSPAGHDSENADRQETPSLTFQLCGPNPRSCCRIGYRSIIIWHILLSPV